MTTTISVGRQDDPLTPAPRERMRTMGTDTVFTQDDLKTHYDAIGSYLHSPTLKQLEKGNLPDPTKLKARCETVIGQLDTVLSSRIWNSTMGTFSTLPECMRCHKPVRKRIPYGADEIEANCFGCKAEYLLKRESDGKIMWHPKMDDVACETKDCDQKMALWPDEIRPGTHWTCRGCGQHWMIQLGIYKWRATPTHSFAARRAD
jgi:hypothetical protein